MLRIETLADRLRLARKEMDLTQAELGDLSGTNQAVIQKIENGRSLLPRSIRQIAMVLNINPAWLLFGAEYATRMNRCSSVESE